MTANERAWLKLPQPSPNHPDETLLWKAEQALRSVAELAEKPDIRNAFAKRLDEFSSELVQAAYLVLQTEHSIAFVGDIGAGKTTALCRAVGLEVPVGMLGEIAPALEVGRGGTTICEVRVVNGPGYGLIVEPRSADEIQREVQEFAHFLMPTAETRGDGETGISREVERAIRNMSGLTRIRPQQSDGTRGQPSTPPAILPRIWPMRTHWLMRFGPKWGSKIEHVASYGMTTTTKWNPCAGYRQTSEV